MRVRARHRVPPRARIGGRGRPTTADLEQISEPKPLRYGTPLSMREPKTSLGLLLLAAQRGPAAPPVLPKPDVDIDLLVIPGINPTKQRKGKSGETGRSRGRKG